MRIIVGSLIVAGLLLALGTMAAACGGDDELTLEEFFQQVEVIDDDFQQRFDRLSDEDFPSEFGPGGDERAQRYKAYAGAFAVLFAEFIDELETVNPPFEAEDAFDELITAGRELGEGHQEFGDRIEGVESLAELYAVLNESFAEAPAEAQADFRYLDACESLQGLADTNGIVVSFDCGIFVRG